MSASVWDDVVGQTTAIDQLRAAAAHGPVHAYLFTGPPGSTKHEAARAFAAMLLTGSDDPTTRDARLILAGEHPDVREIERVGASINVEQARDIVKLSSRSPIESDHKVLILHEFHFLDDKASALLLKPIEEPPDSTTFLIIADFVPPHLVTISSRSVVVEFRAIATDVIAARLLTEGVDAATATAAAQAGYGDLDRARLMATDESLAERRGAFVGAPGRLDGTGHAATTVVTEVLDLIERAAEPLLARQAAELETLEERVTQLGERGSGRKELTDRHKRELRRHRTDEFRTGLAALAAVYRDELTTGSQRDPAAVTAAVHRIHGALGALERNPNERLLLESLFWSLPQLA
ncbi:MAG: hypothetical protein QNM02_05580 [Acidimicrobiia bacterium]|nr:hypothetical protein [Acidimicrobiia bacterium]